jgi:hypothetical protein
VSGQAFLLPLIVGISLLAFALTVIISLSPTEAEMREDAALMAHLAGRPAAPPAGVHRAAGPADAPRGQWTAGPGQYGPGQYGQQEEPGEPDAGRWFRPGH